MPDLSSAKQVSKVSFYQVLDASPVRVDVVVGLGQASGVAVSVGTRPVAHAPMVQNLAVGVGSEVRGKPLVVIATVIDTSPGTDNTMATLRVTGGVGVRELQGTAAADPGQAVVYTFLVNLL